MIDYLYEGYGYDNDDQRLYTLKHGEEARKQFIDGYSTEGMKTYAIQGVLAFEDDLDTEEANKYSQLGQFVSENGANYTDLRGPKCGCC